MEEEGLVAADARGLGSLVRGRVSTGLIGFLRRRSGVLYPEIHKTHLKD
jgi:hypothetical protein